MDVAITIYKGTVCQACNFEGTNGSTMHIWGEIDGRYNEIILYILTESEFRLELFPRRNRANKTIFSFETCYDCMVNSQLELHELGDGSEADEWNTRLSHRLELKKYNKKPFI